MARESVAVAPEHAIREPTRGAEGRAAGLQRKDKLIKKRRLKKISRLKRAGGYWKAGSPTSGASNKKERHNKQITTLTRVIRTFDPKIHTKIIQHNNNGKNEGPPITMGFYIAVVKGVMGLN